MATDPYLDNNGVLRNVPGIADAGELAVFEARLSILNIVGLLESPIQGNYDLAHIKAIHGAIFAGIYPWAGHLRTVDIAKDDSRFAAGQYLESSFQDIQRDISTHLRHAHPEWANHAANCFSDLNAWHGFREGNGRTNRMFIRQIANSVGLDLQFERVSPLEMRGASILGFSGFNGQLQQMFERICVPWEHQHEYQLERRQEHTLER